jgi:hypothetical protein
MSAPLSLAGRTILAADSPLPGETTGYNGGTYDAAEPNTAWDAYQDYGHNHWHNSLSGAKTSTTSASPAPASSGQGPQLRRGRNARGGNYLHLAEQPGVGNKAIALKNCRNVILRDFSILKGGHFGLLLTGVDNLTIDNLKIDTDRDGMDIDCCQNVRVSNCTVNSPWDDGICPKSSYALGYARPTRNVTITNCYVTGCYELGSVLDGTFKKFARRPCSAHRPHQVRHRIQRRLHQHHHLQLRLRGLPWLRARKPKTARSAKTSPSPTSPCAIIVSGPLFLRLGRRLRGPKETTKVGTMKRILISNLECYNAPRQASILSGIPGYPSKMSSSPTSTSRPSAADCPKTPTPSPPSRKTPTPILSVSVPHHPAASSSATCAALK